MKTVDSAHRDVLGRKSDFTNENENFKHNKYSRLKNITGKNAKNMKKRQKKPGKQRFVATNMKKLLQKA